MDHLHFGARSRRKARRRQLVITAWLAGVVAAFFGVPGSNAAFGVLHLAGPTHGLTAGNLSGGHATPSLRVGRILEPALRPKTAPLPIPAPMKSKTHQSPHERQKPHPRPVQPTPAASPTPVAVAPPANSVTGVIYAAAAEAGISGSYLLSVAQCESALNVSAYNSGGYYGLFQFDQQTWSAYGYGSIYDPVAQSQTAARLIAAGQSSRWPNCG
jgi:Transglycosylase-like domain